MPNEITPRYISGEEFYRFCEAKQVRGKCQRCGSGNWELHDTETALGLAGIVNGLDGEPLKQQTHLLTLSCANCGTLWALVRGKVQDWLDENPSKDVADE